MKPPDCLRKIAVLLCLALVIIAVGCSNNEEGSPTSSSDATAANSAKQPVDISTAGSVRGTIKAEGTPPKAQAINMSAVPNCAKQHSSPPMTQDVVLGENNALQNVVVYLQGDFSQYSFEEPSTPVQIDQKGCVYIPRVAAVMAGTSVQFLNSDDTAHNIHPIPMNNRAWNESQASGGAPIERSFAREEVAIPVKCNLHPWMVTHVAILSHPYFQVTGKDGSFELKNVPPGTYTLTAWHEFYGTETQRVTVNPRQEQSTAITFAR